MGPSPNDRLVLIKSMVFYTRSLIEMTKKVKEQDEDVQTGAKFIFKNQGPMFLTVKFNKDKLMETLDWTKVDYNNLLFLKNDTKAAYKDFTRAYKMNIVWFL